jgi:hypothetical protein
MLPCDEHAWWLRRLRRLPLSPTALADSLAWAQVKHCRNRLKLYYLSVVVLAKFYELKGAVEIHILHSKVQGLLCFHDDRKLTDGRWTGCPCLYGMGRERESPDC